MAAVLRGKKMSSDIQALLKKAKGSLKKGDTDAQFKLGMMYARGE